MRVFGQYGRGLSGGLPGVGRLGGSASRFVVFAVVLAAVLSISDVGTARAGSAGTIDTAVLNLRNGPGVWADVIDLMWQGQAVSVLDGPTGDGWYRVDYDGEQGWAYGGYLAIDGQPSGGDAAVGGVQSDAWVATDRLNIRSDASLDGGVLSGAEQGAQLTVTGAGVNGFVPVSFGGGVGWVWADYLSFDGPVAVGPEQGIDVNRSSRTVTLFSGDSPLASYGASLGWDTTDSGFFATAIGSYRVYSKYAGLSWTDWGQAYIRDWVGFDPDRVNGFHSWSMDASGTVLPSGSGLTGGCVALSPEEESELFAFARQGMRVEVHW